MVSALVGAVLLTGRRRATAADPAGGEAGAPARPSAGSAGGEWSAPPMPLSRGAVGGGGADPAAPDGYVADADGRSGGGAAGAGGDLLAGGGGGPIPAISADDAAAVAAAATTAAAAAAAMMAADVSDSDGSSSSHPGDWEADDDSDDERFPRASVGGGMDLGPATASSMSAGEALTFDYIMGAGEAGTRSQGRRLRRAAAAGEGDPMAVLGAGGSLASLGGSAASFRVEEDGEE